MTFNWFDPNGWPELGHVPSSMDTAVIPAGRTIVMNGIGASIGKLTVHYGGALQIVPNPSVGITLDVFKNLIVDGLLSIPATGGEDVTVTFHANESAFVGGGDVPLDTDTGLWVTDNGTLDIQGAAKLAWTTATTGLAAGATSVTLAAIPSGWEVGDEIGVAPTEASSVSGFSTHHEIRTITAISGNTVSFAALSYAHPSVSLPDGSVRYAEIANLTRNIVIQGSGTNRSHIWIRAKPVQTLAYATTRYMGVARYSNGVPTVIGRYGVHFHHGDDLGALGGSTVTGWVNRDSGAHSFVPHMTSNVTFRSCVAFNVTGDAYWWDDGDTTTGAVWDTCLAVHVTASTPAYRLAGFVLGAGANTCRSCVACGVNGSKNSAGFVWPEHGGGHAFWDSHDCVSHNNNTDGIFTWQNDGLFHTPLRFVIYNCGAFGIEHGAYVNAYEYEGNVIAGCPSGAVADYALSASTRALMYCNSSYDGHGVAQDGISFRHHTAPTALRVQIVGVSFKNFTRAAVTVNDDTVGNPTLADVKNPALNGVNALWFSSTCNPGAVIRIEGTDPGIPSGGPWEVRPANYGGGTFYARWNAKIRAITAF